MAIHRKRIERNVDLRDDCQIAKPWLARVDLDAILSDVVMLEGLQNIAAKLFGIVDQHGEARRS